MKAKLTILGCGNSTGVPAIGNYWGACDPHEPRNRRTRCSVLIEKSETRIVIDTGPDFHAQINRLDISDITAVLYSHEHGDHVNGIDELRSLSVRHKKIIPIYGNKTTLDDLTKRFYYLFGQGDAELYPKSLEPHVIDWSNYGQTMTIGDISFVPFEQDHGTCMSVGYRFGDTAYSVDLKDLNEKSIDVLKGVKNWIVDGAGYKQPKLLVHATLEKIYELNAQIGAENVYLTSLSLRMDYQTLIRELPKGYKPAYDGLEIEIGF